VVTNSTPFWDITPCSSLKVNHRFSTCPSTLKVEAICCSETSIDFQWTTRHIPEDRTLSRSMLTSGVKLHGDACLPMSHSAQDTPCWNVLGYLPHCLDMWPCEFHLVSPFKKVLQGHRSRSEKDGKTAVVQWFHHHPRHSLQGTAFS
jgi:hypothetical protein